jgi:endoglucanase
MRAHMTTVRYETPRPSIRPRRFLPASSRRGAVGSHLRLHQRLRAVKAVTGCVTQPSKQVEKSAMTRLNDRFLREMHEFCGRVEAILGLFAWSLLVFLSVALWVPVKPVRAEVRLIERGINLGNALDAPTEGSWGVTLKAEYFETIAKAGFTSVRLPIRWSAHASTHPPYIIAPDFFARVDWAVGQALARKMSTIIDMHHYVELDDDPEAQLTRLIALWDQIGVHYRNFPEKLFFELVNEPSGQLTDERWQQMFPRLLQTVRKTNPVRMIIIGPSYWNSLDHLDHLHLPDQDKNLIATFHYYDPIRFTHQGASWVSGAEQWKNITWMGTAEERETLKRDFEKAADWGRANQRPLYLGEFGSFQSADMDSRARWTNAVAREAEKHGINWAYWEFCSSFGAYDARTNIWRRPLLEALIPQ